MFIFISKNMAMISVHPWEGNSTPHTFPPITTFAVIPSSFITNQGLTVIAARESWSPRVKLRHLWRSRSAYTTRLCPSVAGRGRSAHGHAEREIEREEPGQKEASSLTRVLPDMDTGGGHWTSKNHAYCPLWQRETFHCLLFTPLHIFSGEKLQLA